jgi:hypothetical protein
MEVRNVGHNDRWAYINRCWARGLFLWIPRSAGEFRPGQDVGMATLASGLGQMAQNRRDLPNFIWFLCRFHRPEVMAAILSGTEIFTIWDYDLKTPNWSEAPARELGRLDGGLVFYLVSLVAISSR